MDIDLESHLLREFIADRISPHPQPDRTSHRQNSDRESPLTNLRR